MRIGVDVDFIGTDVYKAGLYHHVLNLVRGFAAARPTPKVGLFLWGATPQKLRRVDEFIRDNRLRASLEVYHAPAGRPYRVRKWLSELQFRVKPLDAFLSVSCPDFPPDPRWALGYLIPDLTTRHAAVYHSAFGADNWERMYAAVRQHADVVFTFSEHTKRDVVDTLGVPANRVAAVPLAAGEEFRPHGPAELAAALGPLNLAPGGYVLTVGTVEPRKNHLTLFRAYADYLARPGVPRLPLVVAGPPGWMAESVVAEPARLGVADAVRFVGRVPDVAALVAGAALLVYPSYYEGFGLPPLEAMACGTPVVTSDATSLPEVVGDAGVMLDPGDVAGFAGAIHRVLTDPGHRADLSRRGLARAAKFSWAATAQGYVDTFRRVIARKRG